MITLFTATTTDETAQLNPLCAFFREAGFSVKIEKDGETNYLIVHEHDPEELELEVFMAVTQRLALKYADTPLPKPQPAQ